MNMNVVEYHIGSIWKDTHVIQLASSCCGVENLPDLGPYIEMVEVLLL